jgi:perosamine synthetase
MKYQIPFAKPSIGEKEISYALDAATNGWGDKCYQYINLFEKSFSNYIGTKHAIATSSCTGALHIALRALNVGIGDEVIVPELTWIASVAPVVYQQAKPVFVDVDPISWCIDPDKVEKAITPKTKAIIAVHLYGNLCNMARLRDLANQYGLFLIEDAAEALGSEVGGHKAGSLSDVAVFSFHGTKTITSGEGGMLVCNSDKIYEKAFLQSNHGRLPSKHTIFWMDELGVKYKMSNLQAAVGLAQLERIDELVSRKREIFHYYKNALIGFELNMNPENLGDKNSYWLPTVVCSQMKESCRDLMLENANLQGIGLRPFFYSLRRFPMFSGAPESKVAADISRSGFNLPSFHDMTSTDMDIVIQTIKPYLLIKN